MRQALRIGLAESNVPVGAMRVNATRFAWSLSFAPVHFLAFGGTAPGQLFAL